MNAPLFIVPTLNPDAARGVVGLAREATRVDFQELIIYDEHRQRFTATCNRGLSQAVDQHVLLVNDDIWEFRPGWLEMMLYILAENPRIGIVAAKVSDHPFKLNQREWYYRPWYPFCCVLIRAECLQQVGLLYPKCKHCGSDFEYCIRARVFYDFYTVVSIAAEVGHDWIRKRNERAPEDDGHEVFCTLKQYLNFLGFKTQVSSPTGQLGERVGMWWRQ